MKHLLAFLLLFVSTAAFAQSGIHAPVLAATSAGQLNAVLPDSTGHTSEMLSVVAGGGYGWAAGGGSSALVFDTLDVTALDTASDVAVPTCTALFLVGTPADGVVLTGIAAGTDGQELILINATGNDPVGVGWNDIWLLSNDAKSTAANRFIVGHEASGIADIPYQFGTVRLIYSAHYQRWIVRQ